MARADIEGADIEARVDALCAAGELGDAATLLLEAGESMRAARLFERACDFAAASRAADDAGELRDAMRLAVLSGQDALSDRMAKRVVADGDESLVRLVAADLCARSYYRHGANLYRGIGALEEAADAYERAGCPIEASGCWAEAGHPAKAARALEAALRGGQEEDPDHLRVALGILYEHHGKHQAAVRVLQQVVETSEHRRSALRSLVRSLRALGLRQAIRDLAPELKRRGVDPDKSSEPPAPVPSSSGATEIDSAEATLYGRYRVVREVATTPHARLLEAIDTLTGDRVAVKILASRGRGTGRDALSRFVREAKALTKLRHPNVVPLREFIPEGPAMVLTWMPGGSLRDLVDRETISPARAAEIVRGVLDALGEAHRLGILHRDVKPSNLLFDGGGTAKLADFGAAHMASSNATVTVGAIGTVAYMAPEQRAGHAATVQSDIFAVGVLLYEMLTGALPPRKTEEIAVCWAHPDLEDAHDGLVRHFIAPDIDDRPSGALEASRAIEALSWPSRIVERERTNKPRAVIAHGKRLGEARRGGDHYDDWLGRDVLVRPLDHAVLAKAAAFARAGHDALPTVLRVDPQKKQVWIDVPRGRPMAQGLSLDDAARARLAEALDALHKAGGVHGAIDVHHVWFHAGVAFFAYPVEQSEVRDLTPADDIAALRQL